MVVAAVFFVVDFPGCLVCWAAGLVAFAEIFVADVAGFVAFFFYPFFQDCANLYVQPHPQIQVQLPGVLMK